jgi:hypothetical protein
VTSNHFFIAKARAQGDVFVLDGGAALLSHFWSW